MTTRDFSRDVEAGPVAGVDEAGRGCLAGPVVAGAVILSPRRPIQGLDDSKRLSAAQRQQLFGEICAKSTCWSVAWCDPREIDCLNILEASLLAMRRAILGLSVRPGFVQVDGNRLPRLGFHSMNLRGDAIVGGDGKIAAISAASICAKVVRDQMMANLDDHYPGYGLARHKGYGTPAHLASLSSLGPSILHRQSFRPVAAI